MIKTTPKVSVVVPVYKVERYIAATIQSVLAQTYSDFELIIVDDESPDHSIEICQQFTDPRIRIVYQKNRGLAGARNTGIRHAQGQYLALLDSDDLWLPQKLERHIGHLESAPTVGVSFSRSAFIDETGEPLGTYQMPKLSGITPEYLLCRNPIGNGSAPVLRREVLDAIRFQDDLYGTTEDFYFDDRFRQSEDIECWIRIAIQTQWQIEGIPEALTLYRVNSEGLSANLLKQFESWEQVINKTRTYAPDVIARWGNVARAYQLRYLARRAVRSGSGAMAVKLVHRAITTHWRVLFEEPRRTLLTVIAAYMLLLLPKQLYVQLETVALKRTGASQRRHIHQSQLGQSL
ncbi:glycosyltransferase family 2 protein [Leptolyngbya sp. FACHB-261]|uniref:glycosyltransferase family 2 protein n=1 Tax=Leptolyngbya sp. FACHB-261 TaxID=2692806 RepID=UPI00168211BE|nr:glycosyltransferase family 2 protein [Leptolyngbya sp. FACHB-261]MBD2105157.1 glycosyltransferase family 2 protein [Leptolyngbya sp. FACHB-261]